MPSPPPLHGKHLPMATPTTLGEAGVRGFRELLEQVYRKVATETITKPPDHTATPREAGVRGFREHLEKVYRKPALKP
jgi:ATP-dependent Lon protease